MKKLLIIGSVILLLSMGLSAPSGWLNYSGAKNYAMWTTKWLQADNEFYWKGDTIKKDSLVYADLRTDSIRFSRIGGALSPWYYAGASSGSYVLPTASATVKGGVKVGSGISISGGVISVSYTETDPVYSAWNKSTGISITHAQISDWATSVSSFVTGTPWTAMGYVTGTPWTGMGYLTANQAHNLDGHSNVTITANSSGEILKWNGTAWVNNTLAEAGIQPAGTYVTGTPWTAMGYVTGTPWTGMGYLTSQTSHADVVVDGDFTSQGIMLRGATSGSYSIIANNSTNWNDAYSNMGKVYIMGESTPYRLSSDYFLNNGTYIYPAIYATPTINISQPVSSGGVYDALLTKQPTLVSGTNIKTVGGTTLLGSGDVPFVVPNDGVTSAKINAYGTPSNGQMLTYSSSYDLSWSTPTTGTGTSGRVTYWNGTNSITSDADFTFDGINLRVGATNGTGVMYSGNFSLTSDSTLKKNIKPIDLSKINRVKFVQFNMKADSTQRTRYGVIAQDVEKIMPELVYTDKNGIKSVAYTDLLIAKVEKQSQIINVLIFCFVAFALITMCLFLLIYFKITGNEK